MPRAHRYLGAFLLGASFFVFGCSDLPTAPQTDAVAPSNSLLGNLAGGLTKTPDHVAVLKRTVPLAQDEVASEVVGRLGGVIRLPRAGMTVLVPFGAVDRPMRITVTAPAGDLVGYQFEPHGLRFQRPLTVTQDLLSTQGLGLLSGLQVVYFDGDLKSTVSPLESLSLWLLNSLGIYRIEHFSGYAIAFRGYVIVTD
jgi:hypothetical protein